MSRTPGGELGPALQHRVGRRLHRQAGVDVDPGEPPQQHGQRPRRHRRRGDLREHGVEVVAPDDEVGGGRATGAETAADPDHDDRQRARRRQRSVGTSLDDEHRTARITGDLVDERRSDEIGVRLRCQYLWLDVGSVEGPEQHGGVPWQPAPPLPEIEVDAARVWAESGCQSLTHPDVPVPSRLVRTVAAVVARLDAAGAGLAERYGACGLGALSERAGSLLFQPAGRASCGGATRLLPRRRRVDRRHARPTRRPPCPAGLARRRPAIGVRGHQQRPVGRGRPPGGRATIR